MWPATSSDSRPLLLAETFSIPQKRTKFPRLQLQHEWRCVAQFRRAALRSAPSNTASPPGLFALPADDIPLHGRWCSDAIMDHNPTLDQHILRAGEHLHSDGFDFDDDFAMMSNDIHLSMDTPEPHTQRPPPPPPQEPAFHNNDNSITLDDDDFESVDFLARSRQRKPRNPETQVEIFHLRVMGTASVTAVCFFCVSGQTLTVMGAISICGGPLSPETIIANDPVTGTLGVVLWPLLVSGPMAYIFAELCSALPEDGGYVIWVLSAFGPMAGLQAGYWGWVSGVFGRVYRIALAYNVLASSFGFSLSDASAFFIKAAIAVVLTVPSLLGARAVSYATLTILLVAVLLPYVLLTVWGYAHETFTVTGIDTSSGKTVDWIDLANTLYWSYDGFHLISTFGGRVRNPARTFPHAIYFAYLLVYMLYLLPMLASYTATRRGWVERDDWSFAALASTIGGSFLHGVIVFSTVVGLLGMYLTRVFCEGHQLSGMAEVSLAPSMLRRRNRRFGSPHISIFVSLVFVVIATTCSFDLLLRLTNTFSALVQLLILAVALKLRLSLPYMPRPAKAMETSAATPSTAHLDVAAAASNGTSAEGAASASASAGEAAAKSASTPIVLTVKTPLERLTEAVASNPLDFNSWVSLLTLVQTDVSHPAVCCTPVPATPRETVEATYERFLVEFPLCFGYWNKYAQYEYSLGSKLTADGSGTIAEPEAAQKKAREVYERGVQAVRHSVDMWMKYCEFLIHTLQSPNDMPRLNQVFKRIMHQPLRNLEEFWEKYNQFVLAQQLQTLATMEEQKALVGDEDDELMDEGLLRVKIVNAVETEKNKSVEGIYRRQAFEAGIDRSYFHVTPVSDAALKNWHSYLDFEEAAGETARCETLYERCLISCANYEEMWLRYTAWKERVQGFDAADAVFQRAVTIFLKHRASIYLEYAAFLETHEKLQKAQDTYMKVLSDVAPKLAEAFLRYCNFERRRGDVEMAKTWFERGLEAVEDQTDVYAYVTISYATFLHRTVGDVASARSVFERSVEKHGTSLLLWLNFLHFEMNVPVLNKELVSRVAHVYELALQDDCSLTMDEKNDLWFQYVEFMESYADNVAKVREGYGTQAYAQADAVAAAGQQSYSSAQYASYYQQQS
ncbi:hypothetical protein BBJ28_00003630 [Nothophytophthora sp. Chile5]|nr:hypothetical protein BBJ28_00003630 [Nothophytophthora sp. Chile5]